MVRRVSPAKPAKLPETGTPAVSEPIIRQIMDLEEQRVPGCRVILFNDEVHSMNEVVTQIQKATGYSLEKAEAIMFEAHTTGQAIVYSGSREDCERVAGVLARIALVVCVEAV